MKYVLASGAVFALLFSGLTSSGCGEPQYDAPPPPPAAEQPPPTQPTEPGMQPGTQPGTQPGSDDPFPDTP